MRKNLFIIILWISFHAVWAQNFPLTVSTALDSASCRVTLPDGSVHRFSASVPREVLSGDIFPLNIHLPGTLPPGCDVDISVTYTDAQGRLAFVQSASVPFQSTAPNQLQSSGLAGNAGQNFNLWFKFPNYLTCNNETGTFTVTFTTCQSSCSVTVQTRARAANFWELKKKAVRPSAPRCGQSLWYVWLDNPYWTHHGNYRIAGTVWEMTSLPVTGPASQYWNTERPVGKIFVLQNCTNDPYVTNRVQYQFTLGDGCEVMQGTTDAMDTVTLVDPSVQVNFAKRMVSNYYADAPGTLPPGCTGYYQLVLNNTGNSSVRITRVVDYFPGNELLFQSATQYGGWTVQAPTAANNYRLEFIPPAGGAFLNPGQTLILNVYFQAKTTLTPGQTVHNAAVVEYQGTWTGGTGGGGSSSCPPPVNCPQPDTTLVRDSVHYDFRVIAPSPMPMLRKCILNPQPVYKAGDKIRFRLIVANGGAAPLHTVIDDPMDPPAGQNLRIDPASVSVQYVEDVPFAPVWKGLGCQPGGIQQPVPAGLVTPDLSDQQHPRFHINGLSGGCKVGKANAVIVEFEAEILPQVFGSKTNTAFAGTLRDQAFYSVDQYGSLAVRKQALPAGANRYRLLIQVANNGTEDLSAIVIRDSLPSCLSADLRAISVTGMQNQPVPFQWLGAVEIQLDPSFILPPGEKVNILIPVTRTREGRCCNIKVTASARIAESGYTLFANDGTPQDPAACLGTAEVSTCCPTDALEIKLVKKDDGRYALSVDSDTLIVQQVDVQLLDYHAEYSEPDCRPDDMGLFGTLHTSTGMLGGLVLTDSLNGTSLLQWTLGTESPLAHTVDLEVREPKVREISCCEVDFYFCLKVTVKTADCEQCEQIVCSESPCRAVLSVLPEKACPGDTLQIRWSVLHPADSCLQITASLAGGPSVTVGSGLSPSGSMAWAVPRGWECNRPVVFTLRGCESGSQCADTAQISLDCCPACRCRGFVNDSIFVGLQQGGIIMDRVAAPVVQTRPGPTGTVIKYDETVCNDTLTAERGKRYYFRPPDYLCTHKCKADFTSTLSGPDGTFTFGRTFTYRFIRPGLYRIDFMPRCGNRPCRPCTLYVKVVDCGTCEIIEDFEQYAPGSDAGWHTVNAYNDGVISRDDNQFIQFVDGPGSSWAYSTMLQGDLTKLGCELEYWVYFDPVEDDVNQQVQLDASITIYQGSSPDAATERATFRLYTDHYLPLRRFVRIRVPLRLATVHGGFPENDYGYWQLHNASNPPTPADVQRFNQLIRNVSGIAFYLDRGANPSEIWWYDNFCIRRYGTSPPPSDDDSGPRTE
ncbi:MAG: hypothetical protein GXO27_01850 [Chlorobi bacterium]|nr:hypothetical protein [Chlorobiota bacterium]